MTIRKARPKALMSLDIRIIEHFAVSGLTADHVQALCVELVEPNIDRRVRIPVAAARLPYFDLDGKRTNFYRLRALETWVPKDDNKPRRYAQPANSGNHLYLPPLLSCPWSSVAAEPAIRIIITEGEKKAACGCVHGFPTLGLGGVWSWKSQGKLIEEFDLLDWQERAVYLAFDSPDVQKNRSVTDALEGLAEELRGRGATVRFVHLPCGSEKVGLDDFLVNEGPQAFDSLLHDATDEPRDAVSELNAELAMVSLGGKAMVLRESTNTNGQPTVDFSRPADVAPLYLNRTVKVRTARSVKYVSAFDIWLKSDRRREFKAVVFEPGGTSPENYNLWKGFAVEPVPGDCSLFTDHVRNNICSGDAALFSYVMGWMAHAVQKPSDLPGTALVLRGKQGVGKSLFCHTFGALFGHHFVQVTHRDQLFGRFNGHLERAYCVSAEEAVWAGNRDAEGVLKAMITEPNRIIERKGQDAIPVRNFTRLLVSSNHDWPVPAGMEERRMVVIDVAANKMQDSAYFGRIVEEREQGGAAALLYLLLERDISAFDPRSIPKTKALLDTKLRTLSGVERFWVDRLEAGYNDRETGAWERSVSCERLHAMYAEAAQQGGERRRAMETELGQALHKMVPGLSVRRCREGGRQVRKWQFPSLEECRRAFETLLGQPVGWTSTAVEDDRKAQKSTKF